MLDSCGRHPHERGAALCRRCGGAWCGSCLVYAFGPKKPPFCMSCAMVAGGVRTSAAMPPMPRKLVRALMRAERAEVKAEAKEARATTTERVPEPEPQLAGPFGDTDWSSAWEEEQPANTG